MQHESTVPFVETHAFSDFCIGATQGCAFALSGQPFDAVRLNSQTGNLAVAHGRCTTREVARHIWRGEGLRGFFQGWSFPAFGFTLGRAVQQLTMNSLRDHFIQQQRLEAEAQYQRELARVQAQLEERERSLPWYASTVRALGSTKLMEIAGVEQRDPALMLLLAGGGVGDNFGSRIQNDTHLETWKNLLCATVGAVAYTTIHTPFDMVRVRMLTQNQYSHRLYHHSFDCAWKLYECGGVRKLYLGYKAALARDIPAQVITFGLYGILRPMLPQDERQQVQARYGVALGGVVGMISWSCIIPLDNIKTRIQTAPEDLERKPSWLAAARRIHVLYGWRGFYIGLPPALMKACVSNATLFASMEFAATHISMYQRQHAEERHARAAQEQGLQR